MRAKALSPRSPGHSLTERLTSALANPASSPDFDFAAYLNNVLRDVGMTATDSGGTLSFYGKDPIIPSPLRFGSMAAIGLAARSVAVAAVWRARTGEGQDVVIDVRKALRRFCGFFEGKWETINGRAPTLGAAGEGNPFLKLPRFRETRDGRHIMALNIYPGLRSGALKLLRCDESVEAVQNAILQWRAEELEKAAAEAGVVFAMVRTNDEFRRELQYTEVLSLLPLISLEKIAESEPVPFTKGGTSPLDGIRALGMGHVIAGGAIGRDLAYYGADVLNIWRPHDTELDILAWDAQVGMRSTILDSSKDDRAKFNELLKDADIFFANRRPGFLRSNGLSAEELCAEKPGLIHVTVGLHGDTGPWSNRPGFDEIGAAVAGLYCIEGSPSQPQSSPIVPICDNVVAWLSTVGALAALRRRAVHGGSYRVNVSLTRVVLWLLTLGIFDKSYAQTTAGSTDEHTYVTPELFTAETALGTYQGLTEQVRMSRTVGSFKTVLTPRGSSKPEWLRT
jgi:crotonobetainyl-CoA:carnitine CoA-transferase CaiB-like acyl-CoA transferase